jgi:hypothetical protein
MTDKDEDEVARKLSLELKQAVADLSPIEAVLLIAQALRDVYCDEYVIEPRDDDGGLSFTIRRKR